MAEIKTEADVRRIIIDGIRKRRDYFSQYRKKHRATFVKRNRAFAAAKRVRSIPFSSTGYFDPKTGTIEINKIAFGTKLKNPR